MQFLDERKIQQSITNLDLLALFEYSQNYLDSFVFFKQIDTSYASISELYDKVKHPDFNLGQLMLSFTR